METMWSKVDVSWSISSLFAILHFDLWMIGYHTNINIDLMDAMCDISMLRWSRSRWDTFGLFVTK